VLEPESLAARRAVKEARRRRRRFIGAVVALGLSLSGIAAVVAVAQGGTKARRAARPALAAEAQARVRALSVPKTAHVSAIDALGDANIRWLTAIGLPIYCGGPRGNEVAFTFDDGPGVYTHYAVKKLTAAHEHATFFVVGRSMNGWPGWLPEEAKLGAIGDHTSTHPVLTELAPDAITSQITRTRDKIENAIGQPIYLFRPPYGARNAVVDRIARRLGLLEIMWSVDSGDSLGADWSEIIHNVEAGLHPGAIILVHENRGQTIRALTTLLPELRRRHLRSVSLPELFATDPPSVAQVERGENGCAAAPPATLSGG
jgi:peptidoglycan/xylan/chitin deacetylase (PgdA/CDA1 family)